MELSIYNIDGKDTGRKVNLSDELLNSDKNTHAVYLDVKQFLAQNRQGTSKTKQRNEVSGSTRKLHKQKGTGGSRKGSIKNPLYKSGGRIFGPEPRDYSFKLNKKVKRLARRTALSQVIHEGRLTVVEDFSFEAPKTKSFISFLNSFNASNEKVLLLTGDKSTNVFLSGRNLPQANIMPASELNTYEVLDARRVFIVESGVETVQNLISY